MTLMSRVYSPMTPHSRLSKRLLSNLMMPGSTTTWPTRPLLLTRVLISNSSYPNIYNYLTSLSLSLLPRFRWPLRPFAPLRTAVPFPPSDHLDAPSPFLPLPINSSLAPYFLTRALHLDHPEHPPFRPCRPLITSP